MSSRVGESSILRVPRATHINKNLSNFAFLSTCGAVGREFAAKLQCKMRLKGICKENNHQRRTNMRQRRSKGTPARSHSAVRGMGRWNGGGQRRRGEEVNSSSRQEFVRCPTRQPRCAGFNGYAVIPPTPLVGREARWALQQHHHQKQHNQFLFSSARPWFESTDPVLPATAEPQLRHHCGNGTYAALRACNNRNCGN